VISVGAERAERTAMVGATNAASSFSWDSICSMRAFTSWSSFATAGGTSDASEFADVCGESVLVGWACVWA
jgi:hypothetical protein